MHAAHRLFPRLLTLFAYNFLMYGPISTIFGMKVDIGNQIQIPHFYKNFEDVV